MPQWQKSRNAKIIQMKKSQNHKNDTNDKMPQWQKSQNAKITKMTKCQNNKIIK